MLHTVTCQIIGWIVAQDIELGHPLRCTDVGDRKTSHQDTGN